MRKTIAAMLCAPIAGAAAAQDVARPASADAGQAARAPAYESAFRDYRPYADPEPARWRDVNDEVGRLGGHVGHVPRVAPRATPGAAKPPAERSGK